MATETPTPQPETSDQEKTTQENKLTNKQHLLNILTIEGKQTGRQIELPANPFLTEPHKHLLYLDITNIRNHQRQGTSQTKEKSAITGSTRKLYKQKGTGRARKGSIKSGILRGGGNTFGPKARQYGFTMNKKEKKRAQQSALSIKTAKKQLLILEDFSLEKPSTKQYLRLLNNLAIAQEKNLWILPNVNKNLVLSARNVAKNNITTVAQMNSYDLLNATNVVCLESALPLIVQKFA